MFSSYLLSFDLVAQGGLYHFTCQLEAAISQVTDNPSCITRVRTVLSVPLCAVTPGGSEVLWVKLIIYYSLSQ